jgi:hypothetical protein
MISPLRAIGWRYLAMIGAAVVLSGLNNTSWATQPLVVPFDFSHTAIGLDVVVKGTPMYMLLDTGVDPSVVNLQDATAVGLPVERGEKGEASGFGEGSGPSVFASRIEGLTVGGYSFPGFDALAADLGSLSAHYGRKLNGVLGFSFLHDKVILIDYPQTKLVILPDRADVRTMTQGCRIHWNSPLVTVESYPVIPRFRLGDASGPVTLDTGSNGAIGLYQSALALPGVRGALVPAGTTTHAGVKGEVTSSSYVFNSAVGFGPFSLPPGEPTIIHKEPGAADKRIANIGNEFFARMELKILLDYRGKYMAFYGNCPEGSKRSALGD